MPTFTLTDTARDVWVERFETRGGNPGAPWSVTKQVLRGGRREGVDLIDVDNGALAFSVVPTRGMGLGKGRFRGLAVGWESPVRDGPVNPAFVNLADRGGLGWLDGFDELLARCGLGHNGAPYTQGGTTYGLHGRVANTPAHLVAVHVGDGPDAPICVEGQVDESSLFLTQVRMASTVTTAPGANWLRVRDEFRNLSDMPQEMQVLYHWNLGPPFLEEGARFSAPARTVVPRNPRAAEGLDGRDTYGPPEPGFAEQVYLYELLGAPGAGLGGSDARPSLAILRNREGDRAIVLRFNLAQLPAFTLWKNTGGLRSGYVTGLEPGTNYPNPRPFEKAQGRVVTLEPGASYVAEMTLEVLDTRDEVARAEAEVQALQRQAEAVVHRSPVGPFTAP